MFDHTSRYYGLEIATMTVQGRTVSYVRRRFVSSGAGMQVLAEAQTAQGERLEMLAHRTLGDPLAWWRVCDANDTLDPSELTAEPGRTLRIPMPEAPKG